MNLNPKNLITILEQHGFVYIRTKGSHHIFHNDATRKTAVVPVHEGKDMKKGTVFAILKHAGIDTHHL